MGELHPLAECCRTCRIEDLPDGDYDDAVQMRNAIDQGIYRDIDDYMCEFYMPQGIVNSVKSCLREKKLGNCGIIGVEDESESNN